MKRLALASLVSLILPLIACSSARPKPPPPRLAPKQLPPVHASVSVSAPTPSPACLEAESLLQKAEAQHNDKRNPKENDSCVPELASRAAAQCPSLAERARQFAALAEQADREAKVDSWHATKDGRWLVQGTQRGTRLWTISPDGPKLAFRLAGRQYWQEAPDGRFVAQFESDLSVFDTPSGKLSVIPYVVHYRVVGNKLVVADEETLRTYDWTTLTQQRSVTTSVPVTEPFRPLLGGRVLHTGNSLVSLESGAVVAQNLDRPTFSSDESRLASCTATNEIVVVDTLTGRTLKRLPLPGRLSCDTTSPTISPDGRNVLTVEIVPKGVRITAINWATGNRTSLLDGYRIGGFTGGASLHFAPSAPNVVCMSYDSFHHIDDVCPWSINGGGALVHGGALPQLPSTFGVPGDELARALSPDGKRLVLATYLKAKKPHPSGYPTREHLRLFVIDTASKKALRNAEVFAGPFLLPSSPMSAQPSISFATPTRVLFTPGDSNLGSGVFDIETGSFVSMEPGTYYSGGYAMRNADNTLIDLRTLKRYSLLIDPASWTAAPRLAPTCKK